MQNLFKIFLVSILQIQKLLRKEIEIGSKPFACSGNNSISLKAYG